MEMHPLIDPFAIHYDTYVGDVYTLDTASITLVAGDVSCTNLIATGTGDFGDMLTVAKSVSGVFIGITSKNTQPHSTSNTIDNIFRVKDSAGGDAATFNIRTSLSNTSSVAKESKIQFRAYHGNSFVDTCVINGDAWDFEGRISSGQLVVTEANDGTIDVSGINSILADAPGDSPVTINDFTNGVAGQIIYIAVRDNTDTTTITDQSGSNQVIHNHDTGQDLIIEAGSRGGAVYVCDGSAWYDVSHAKHV